MSSPKWLAGLKELSKKPITHTDLDKLFAQMLAEQNDRGAALIGGALVEVSLTKALGLRMVELTETESDGLFGRDAPLSTFSDKIRIAYAFGIIDANMRRDLDRLREIRNAFAHTMAPVEFDTPEVQHACQDFVADTIGFKDLPWPDNHPRTRYLGAVGELMRALAKVKQTPRPDPALTLSYPA